MKTLENVLNFWIFCAKTRNLTKIELQKFFKYLHTIFKGADCRVSHFQPKWRPMKVKITVSKMSLKFSHQEYGSRNVDNSIDKSLLFFSSEGLRSILVYRHHGAAISLVNIYGSAIHIFHSIWLESTVVFRSRIFIYSVSFAD